MNNASTDNIHAHTLNFFFFFTDVSSSETPSSCLWSLLHMSERALSLLAIATYLFAFSSERKGKLVTAHDLGE